MRYPVHYLAQSATYNCGAYGSEAYGTNANCASTQASGGGQAGGSLADTGYDVIVPVALALAVIIASVVYIVRRQIRRKRTKDIL